MSGLRLLHRRRGYGVVFDVPIYAAREYGRTSGRHDDPQVESERLALDVLEVELNSLIPGDRIPAPDLGKAGHARPYRQASHLSVVVTLDLITECGSRTNQAHIAPQHVEDLREFIERPPS